MSVKARVDKMRFIRQSSISFSLVLPFQKNMPLACCFRIVAVRSEIQESAAVDANCLVIRRLTHRLLQHYHWLTCVMWKKRVLVHVFLHPQLVQFSIHSFSELHLGLESSKELCDDQGTWHQPPKLLGPKKHHRQVSQHNDFKIQKVRYVPAKYPVKITAKHCSRAGNKFSKASSFVGASAGDKEETLLLPISPILTSFPVICCSWFPTCRISKTSERKIRGPFQSKERQETCAHKNQTIANGT